MQNPTTEGLSLSMFESQYDAYLLTVRGLSRSTRSLHHHVVHKLLSSRFPIGYISWSEIRFNDFVQFLTNEFSRLHNRWTQTTWLMVLRSLLRYLSREGYLPLGWDAALPAIATRKHTSLPRGLSQGQVRALWAASEGRKLHNLRDRALLFVANDSMRAYLYHNERNGTFREVGLASGMAVTEEGAEMAAMCLSFGDYDNDGLLDLYISDFQDAGDHLWHNEGGGSVNEVSHPSGLTDVTRPFLSFGGGFFDYDNDGWLDLFIANGHVYPSIEKTNPGSHYKQINLLLHNERKGKFSDVTAATGNGFSVPHLGRGVAFGDLFNDGHVDVVVENNDDPPLFLRNNSGEANHFVSFKLVGTRSNRDAVGARLRVEAGGIAQIREIAGGGSYLSQSELRAHFGIGSSFALTLLKLHGQAA